MWPGQVRSFKCLVHLVHSAEERAAALCMWLMIWLGMTVACTSLSVITSTVHVITVLDLSRILPARPAVETWISCWQL